MHLDSSGEGWDKPGGLDCSEQNQSSFGDFAEEKKELEWVLSHPEISRSASLVRFLTFICNKYFAGESREIREQTIAVQALGRRESNFDSRIDPIVRVTARMLRKRLQNLYKSDGRDHNLQIELPLGHYVPEFVRPRTAGRLAESTDTSEADSIDPIEDLVPRSNIAPATPGQDDWRRPLRPFKQLLRFAPNLGAAWMYPVLVLAVAAIFFAGFFLGQQANQPQRPAGQAVKWGDPIWSDEFDGAAQNVPDPSKWTYDPEDAGRFSNGERAAFCSPLSAHLKECDPHHPNAFLDGGGHLVLRAQKRLGGVWTLARITTKGLKNFQFGRIEARMRLPVGTGLWPSFVLVGANKDAVGWPACGSVDIAENVSMVANSNGLGPTMIRSTLHGPRYFGANGLWHDFKLPNGARVDDGSFHTYGVIWSPGMVQFYVDDPSNIYAVHDVNDLPEGGAWVFDHPFFITMSLAAGGDWAGDPDAKTPNPADMLVDYVRIYKIPTVQAPSIELKPVDVKSGSSVASTIALRSSSYAGRVHLACSTDTPTAACSLATPVVNFSGTLTQEDTLTISTDSFTEKGRVVAPPGRYMVTITATTISGDRAQKTVPFEVRNGE